MEEKTRSLAKSIPTAIPLYMILMEHKVFLKCNNALALQ